MSCASNRSSLLREARLLAKQIGDTEKLEWLSKFKPTKIGFPLSYFIEVSNWIFKVKKEMK